MYVVGNVEKYLQDNPGSVKNPDLVLERVRAEADSRGVVSCDLINKLFSEDVAEAFREEVDNDPEHHKLWEKVMDDEGEPVDPPHEE